MGDFGMHRRRVLDAVPRASPGGGNLYKDLDNGLGDLASRGVHHESSLPPDPRSDGELAHSTSWPTNKIEAPVGSPTNHELNE